MTRWSPLFFAFVLATLIALLELITSKYPRTYFLLKKCWALYAYGVAYGLISLGIMYWMPATIQIEGFDLSNPWLIAIVVGITVKAFLHIRLFSVTVGS